MDKGLRPQDYIGLIQRSPNQELTKQPNAASCRSLCPSSKHAHPILSASKAHQIPAGYGPAPFKLEHTFYSGSIARQPLCPWEKSTLLVFLRLCYLRLQRLDKGVVSLRSQKETRSPAKHAEGTAALVQLFPLSQMRFSTLLSRRMPHSYLLPIHPCPPLHDTKLSSSCQFWGVASLTVVRGLSLALLVASILLQWGGWS